MSCLPRSRSGAPFFPFFRFFPFLAVLASLAACSDSPGGPDDDTTPPPIPAITVSPAELAVEQVAGGFTVPVHLVAPPGDDRLFVVERFGRIAIVENGQTRTEPFLDVSGKLATDGSERGLLSMAFHPDFADNGHVYMMYTATNGAVTIERYTVPAGTPNIASPASAKTILSVPHPGLTHNGGLVTFGPDGMLYVSIGDGGGRGDPSGNAQKLDVLLGKLLRIDVDGGDPYAIPDDNPFAGQAGRRGEIWAYGLRNPWRYTFAGTGAQAILFIADVGMDHWEEINAVAAIEPGLDYGWNVTEGGHCFDATTCDIRGITFPIHEYESQPPCTSITGGFVHDGTGAPEHAGRYFFADYCRGFLRSISWSGSEVTEALDWDYGETGWRVTSFGRDGHGALYAVLSDGRIMRLGAAL